MFLHTRFKYSYKVFFFFFLQAVNVIGDMFISIFKGLQKEFAEEIVTVGKQYPAEPFKFLEPR